MPDDLLEAHHAIDEAIERCYCKTRFAHDEARLEYLFKLNEKMTSEESNA